MTRTDLVADRRTADRARTLLVVGLATAGVGILVLYLTGVPGFPTVPPGPIIMGAAALLVACVRWRWIPAVGLVAAVFLTVGAIAAGVTADLLLTPQPVGPFLGAWLHTLGLVVALVAGAAALARAAATR